jgi:hypothetical protein
MHIRPASVASVAIRAPLTSEETPSYAGAGQLDTDGVYLDDDDEEEVDDDAGVQTHGVHAANVSESDDDDGALVSTTLVFRPMLESISVPAPDYAPPTYDDQEA